MSLRFIQLELPLFEPPNFESLINEAGIRGLTVEFNDRLRNTWRLSRKPWTGARVLTLPRIFETAPQHVKTALIGWALLPFRSRRKKDKNRLAAKKQFEITAWEFLKEKGVPSGQGRRIDPQKLSSNTVGARFDLAEVYENVNKRYFNGLVSTFVKWGTPKSTTSFQTYRKDREGNRHSIITISGVYNHPDVPEYAIESVLFHEMLHIKIPPLKKNGRNVIHGRDFKREEKAFPLYRQWRQWEKTAMPGIIRDIARQAKAAKKKK
jgi:hypothetical protein